MFFLHGHQESFCLCLMAHWLLGRSAMINSGRPRGRTARPGYPAGDLVSSCHEETGFMAVSATELCLGGAQAEAGDLSHLFLK